MRRLIIFLLFTYVCCQDDLQQYFTRINEDVIKLNRAAAHIAWESSVNPSNPALPSEAAAYQEKRILWQTLVCEKLGLLQKMEVLNKVQERQTYLLCRGPIYTFEEARTTSALLEDLQSIYFGAKICFRAPGVVKRQPPELEAAILSYLSVVNKIVPELNASLNIAAKISTHITWTNCLNGEVEVEKMMEFSRHEALLRWLWLSWRESVGPQMRKPYSELVKIENTAAQRNGYKDIGASWRDDLEIPFLKQVARNLYEEIKPLYVMLHGVVRFFLRNRYGDEVPKFGPIPAHLLGNLWAQNWEAIVDIIIPYTINLDESIKNANWSVKSMVRHAEDFYTSLGLPPMPEQFWIQSVFEKRHNNTRCHGTAADMFNDIDFRLLHCSGVSAEDFYIIHHELGHLQYFMAYQRQPGIFRQANAALQETIGDAIMYAVMTPQHLYRLNLINDSLLYAQGKVEKKEDNEIIVNAIDDSDDVVVIDDDIYKGFDKIPKDDIILLKTALNKIPQIPFALLIEEIRWKFFENEISTDFLNDEFWAMARELQGVAPAGTRGEESFDLGAQFHVPANTPYMRYFMSSFLQHQLFETLCKASVFGRRGVTEKLPPTITLNRCDIYGSKAAGKILKDLMSRGHSQQWREILKNTTGIVDISASALMEYYQPLMKLLKKIVHTRQIPLGW